MGGCIGRIGTIMQKIHNLDHTQINLKNNHYSPEGVTEAKGAHRPQFISDRQAIELDQEDRHHSLQDEYSAPQRDPKQERDYDHLDIIKSDSMIRLFFQ